MKVTPDLVNRFIKDMGIERFDSGTDISNTGIKILNICCRPESHIAFAAPPRYGKSTVCSFNYLLSVMMLREFNFAVVFSNSIDASITIINNIKNEIENNKKIRSKCGVKSIVSDNGKEIIIEINDGYEFKIAAKEALSSINGLLWRGSRPDLIIADDIESGIISNDKKHTVTYEIFREWFYSRLLACAKSKSKIIVFGTLYCYSSLLGDLIDDVNWCSERIPAVG